MCQGCNTFTTFAMLSHVQSIYLKLYTRKREHKTGNQKADSQNHRRSLCTLSCGTIDFPLIFWQRILLHSFAEQYHFIQMGQPLSTLWRGSGRHDAMPATPHTLHPTHHTLHPTPYTLHPTPYTLHPKPFTLHPTPYTLHPSPFTLHPAPYALHPTPFTLHPTPHTLHSTPYTLHPSASILNPEPLNQAAKPRSKFLLSLLNKTEAEA